MYEVKMKVKRSMGTRRLGTGSCTRSETSRWPAALFSTSTKRAAFLWAIARYRCNENIHACVDSAPALDPGAAGSDRIDLKQRVSNSVHFGFDEKFHAHVT